MNRGAAATNGFAARSRSRVRSAPRANPNCAAAPRRVSSSPGRADPPRNTLSASGARHQFRRIATGAIEHARTDRSGADREAYKLPSPRRCAVPGHVYFTGRVHAVLMGWRTITARRRSECRSPSPRGFLCGACGNQRGTRRKPRTRGAFAFHSGSCRAGASEADCFITRRGPIDFSHYDFYSQALAKLERFHATGYRLRCRFHAAR